MIVRKAVFVNDSYREREYVPVVVPPVLVGAKPVKKVATDVKGGEGCRSKSAAETGERAETPCDDDTDEPGDKTGKSGVITIY